MTRRGIIVVLSIGALALLALGVAALWREARTPPRFNRRALAVLERNHRLMAEAPVLSGEVTATYSASAGPVRTRLVLQKPNRARLVFQSRLQDAQTGKWRSDYEVSVAEIKISNGATVKTYEKRPQRPYARLSTETADPHGVNLIPYNASTLFGFFDPRETHWARIEEGHARDLDFVRLDAPAICDGATCQTVTYRTSVKPTPVPLLDVLLGRASWRAFRSARNPPPSAYSKAVTLSIDAQGLIRRAVTRDTDPYVSGTIARTEETRSLRAEESAPARAFRFPAHLKPGQSEP